MQPSLEVKIYDWFAQLRTAAFKPLLKFLDLLRITPDLLSYFGIGLMIAFIFIIDTNPVGGFWLIIARTFIDSIDGSLARYQKIDNDRGKFVDVMADQLGFALYIFGIVKVGLSEGLPAMMFLYFTVILTVLMIIKKSLHKKSDWLLYGQAGALPYVLIYMSYIFFGIYAFGGHNYLSSSCKIFAAILIAKTVLDFWIIRNTEFKPKS